MRKISQKITFGMVLSIVIVSMLIGIVSVAKSTATTTASAKKNLTETSSDLSGQLNNTINIFQTKLEDLSLTIANNVDVKQMQNNPAYQAAYSKQIIPLELAYAKSGKINVDCYVDFLMQYSKNGILIGPAVMNQDGKGFVATDFNTKISDMETNKSDYDWYYEPIQTGKGYWTAPYTDSITKLYMVSYVVPIMVDGKAIGVVGMDIKFDAFENVVNGAKVYNTGHVSLLNSNYNYLVDPTFKTSDNLRSVDKGDLKGLADYVDKHSNGVYNTTVAGKPEFIGFSKLINGDVLLVTVSSSEVLQDVNSLKFIIILIVILGAIIGILVALLVSSRIAAPIRRLTELFKKAAVGDYSSDISQKDRNRKDEIGVLASSYGNILENIRSQSRNAQKIAEGDLNFEITEKSDKDVLAISMKKVVGTLKALTGNIITISENAVRGDLKFRGDSEQFKGEYRKIVDGINDTLDAVAQPIGEVRNVVSCISLNDYTVKMEGSYQGTFKDLGNDINMVRDKLLLLQNNMVQISKGNIGSLEETKKVGKLSENDNMTPALIAMMQNIENLIMEVKRITAESVNGNVFNARGNTAHFEGGFRQIIDGFNETLDSISNPLRDIMKILNAMAVNDFTSEIGDGYNGDYRKLRDAVESVEKSLLSAQNAAVQIASGDVSELENYKAVGKRSENDELVPAFTRMMQNIQSLIDESTMIAQSAADGDLSIRGNVDKFKGGYATIVSALNNLLNAVESPVGEVKRVMTAISDSRLDERIHKDYKGEFKVMADAVNTTASMLEGMVNRISYIITEMSTGDFNVEQIEKFKGNFSPISEALNAILDSFNNLLGSINATSEQVASGSVQVSQGSQSLSVGATEQASVVEELTASVSQISAQTLQNAADATEANSLVTMVKEGAFTSNENMKEMLQSISDIGDASSNISKIIKVIDDIAFQTNILALNAAVEAARAGQNGKGFAVVAEEVRNLAAKSAEAARNTTGLIEGTITKVKSGTEVAGKTANALNNIVEGIDKVTMLVAKISTASNEQATGIAQIDKGLQQVSQVIQTVSSTSEESSAASEELASQAELLKQQVANFSLRKADK